MSALRKVDEQKPKRVSPRVAIRDGAIVKVKQCRSCGEDKIVTDDIKTSGFYFARRKSRKPGRPASLSWGADCKACTREQRAHANLPPETLEVIRAQSRAQYQRGRKDPEQVAVERARYNDWYARRRQVMTDEEKERRREISRRDYAQRRIADPDYYSRGRREERRRARLARESEARHQQAEAIAAARGWGCTRAGTLTVPAAPFACWLRAYGDAECLFRSDLQTQELRRDDAGDVMLDGTMIALRLGIEPKRVTSVLAGAQDMVSFDVVDRAIGNGVLPGLEIMLPGGPAAIWDVFDLFEA